MAIQKLKHIQVLVLDKYLDNVIALAAQKGLIEFINYRESANEADTDLLHPVDVSETLSKLSNLRKDTLDLANALGIDCPLNDNTNVAYPELKLSELLNYYKKIEQFKKNVSILTNSLKIATETKQKFEKIKQKLEFLLAIDFNIGDLRKFSFIEITMGRISSDNLASLEQILNLTKRSVLVYPLRKEGTYVYVILFYLKSFAREMRDIFNSVYFEPYEIPTNISGTPKEIIDKTEQEIKLLALDIQKSKIELEQLRIIHEKEIKKLAYNLSLFCKIKEIEKEAGGTEKVYLIHGWLPEEHEPEYHKTLKDITADTAIYFTEDATTFYVKNKKKVKIPTLLKNHPMFKPFESIIEMYGKPAYHEFDPTPVFGLSFLLMFGMMFGDIGQGMILFLTGLAVRTWMQKKFRSIAHLVMSASISSVFFGLLYGECFGFEVMHPLWLSPMEDTMTFLMFSVGFGIFFMSIGLIISLINNIRAKNWGNLLFGKNGLAGIWFYWGTILFFVVLGIKIGWSSVIFIWLIPVLLMFFKEPLETMLEKKEDHKPNNIIDFVIGSFFELLDTVVGFLSNTISFVRIAAFALNHIGLFMVVKILAQMITIKTYDSILDFVILVFGNILIICVEGLIVTIQVLRLEYYEFFSKFFTGNGTSFKPAKMV